MILVYGKRFYVHPPANSGTAAAKMEDVSEKRNEMGYLEYAYEI